jgi:hypothetical protein
MRITVASTVFLIFLALPSARALSSHDDLTLDAAGLAQLEQRAEHAEAREQAFLYTELVQVYTQMAGKQMAAGDMDQANATLKQIQHFAEKIHGGLAKNTKKLKDAEMMLHMATYHLGEYMHFVSGDDKPVAESTLKQLNKVHDELLAQVFAH